LDPGEQKIFLDIACCLKGQTKSQITSILDACDFSTEIGMRNDYFYIRCMWFV